MTMNDFCNKVITQKDLAKFWVEELSEYDMDGSGFDPKKRDIYCSICFTSGRVCEYILHKRLALAEVVYFQAVNTDEIWVQVLPRKEVTR